MKVAISLPKETFDAVEQSRRELGLARSAVIVEAMKLWLRQREEQALERRYEQGYRKRPETPAEVEGMFRAGLSSFAQEQW